MIRTVQYVLYDTVPYVRTYCNKQRTSEQKEGKRKRYRYTLRRTQTLPRLFIFCTQDVDSMVVGRGTKEEARWVLIVEKTVHTLGTRDRASFSHLTPMGLLSAAVCCTVLYSTVQYVQQQYSIAKYPGMQSRSPHHSRQPKHIDVKWRSAIDSIYSLEPSREPKPSEPEHSRGRARVPTRYFMY